MGYLYVKIGPANFPKNIPYQPTNIMVQLSKHNIIIILTEPTKLISVSLRTRAERICLGNPQRTAQGKSWSTQSTWRWTTNEVIIMCEVKTF